MQCERRIEVAAPPSSCGKLDDFFRSGAKGEIRLKHRRWYEEIVERAKTRDIPVCYTELHHIIPKSLGGSDAAENLVRLTYREHFLVHWLLTKFTTGAQLRKMQRALFAMTMPLHGARIISGWQFEAAKRAVRDLELDPEAEAAWMQRFREKREQDISAASERRRAVVAKNLDVLNSINNPLLSTSRSHLERVAATIFRASETARANGWRPNTPMVIISKPRKRARKPRPSKRVRLLMREERAAGG